MAAAVGCSQSAPPVFVPLPPSSGARSLLVAVEGSGRQEVYAVDPQATDSASALRVRLEPDEHLVIYGLSYARDLVSLGLSPGPVEDNSDPARSRALPTPDAVHSIAVAADGRSDAWLTQSGVPDSLRGLRLPGTPCRRLAVTKLRVPMAGFGTVAIPLPDGSTLLGVEGEVQDDDRGGFFRATAAGVVPVPHEPALEVPSAGFRDDSGQLWIGTKNGMVARATLTDRLVLQEVAHVHKIVRYMDGETFGSAFELFALAYEGQMYRVTETGATQVHDFEAPTDLAGNVVWLGSGRAVVASPGSRSLFRYDVSSGIERVATGAGRALSDVAWLEDLGLVLGTLDGDLMVPSGLSWTKHETVTAGRYGISGIVRLGEGILFTTGLGELGQYHAEIGLCPMEPLGYEVLRLAALNDGSYVAFGLNGIGVQPVVTFIRPVPY